MIPDVGSRGLGVACIRAKHLTTFAMKGSNYERTLPTFSYFTVRRVCHVH